MTDKKYQCLFEPVDIGPVTAPNRFYQVPHCNALGHMHPMAEARNRGIKAEGGWGVVCTQEVEIHPSSEVSPASEGRIWDDSDIPALTLTTDAIHEHGSLAGIELVYNGHHSLNNYSRIPPMSPSGRPVDSYAPVQARKMLREDFRNLRQWYVDAAKRARRAGFDIVYVYAGHDMTLLQHFLSPRYNQRTDEYGGSLENRLRLLKETLTDVKDAVGDTCGIALRFAVDELMGPEGIEADGEGHEIVSRLADIPDLWDVNISNWGHDSATARFKPDEGYQESYTAFVKELTNKPVVAVGRFTSPDAMVSRIKRGVQDLIGAARPSIADPFLPDKIRNDQIHTIRECIGCNICVASDNVVAPIRCTQNPTMGEEWKRGWHPEKIAPATKPQSVLVVGAGPSGLECALQLANRGHHVVLAEATREMGGRCCHESRLPGMGSYIRVRDYRAGLLQTMPNVHIYLDNRLTAEDIIELDIDTVFLATGSHWRSDGAGRQHPLGLNFDPELDEQTASIITPDSIMDGRSFSGRVLVYDDDHYYMGGVIAEKLALDGCEVSLVTPASDVSAWTDNTLELGNIRKRLIAVGVTVQTSTRLVAFSGHHVELACVFSETQTNLPTDQLCLVTSRLPNDALAEELYTWVADKAGRSMTLLGDCLAPATIAAAVYSGHLAARRFQGAEPTDTALYRRHMPELERG